MIARSLRCARTVTQQILGAPAKLRRYTQSARRIEDIRLAWDNLPLVEPQALVGDGPVLVLAPHPDDESLGCGGLIAACCARGQDVYVVILTDGAGSHPHSRDYPAARLSRLREEEARAAVAALGLADDRISFFGLPDGRAPLRGRRLRAVAAQIEAVARVRSI